MSRIKIFPRKLKGTVKIPASKSIAHRAIICVSLGAGAGKLYDLTTSDDINATIAAMEALGAILGQETDGLQVIGMRRGDDGARWAEKFGLQTWRLHGQGNKGGRNNPLLTIDCAESGSTLRFLVPITLVRKGGARFTGRGRLGQRPMEPYFRIFERQGISFSQSPGPELDLTVKGELQPGEFFLPGDVSSQFISGLLFALPLLKGNSTIHITTPLESKAYINMTIKVMRDFGVEVFSDGGSTFKVEGRQRYQSRDYLIEGDYSQAAFFLAAGALGAEVEVTGLQADSLQGDKEILNIIRKMGGQIRQGDEGLAARPGEDGLKAAIIDASQCPDLVPVLSVMAALSRGTTEIIRAERLRLKESDRLQAMATELNKLGARVTERPDGLIIEGVEQLKGGVELSSHNDHRIAMSLAVAAVCCREPVVIDGSECVQKSYPHFWQDYQLLGGSIQQL